MVICINYEYISRINFNCMWILNWKKQKISLIRRYHYKRVKDQDRKIYYAEIGVALIIVGLSFIFMWLINYFTNVSYGILVLAVGFVTGMFLFVYAEIKFNRDKF